MVCEGDDQRLHRLASIFFAQEMGSLEVVDDEKESLDDTSAELLETVLKLPEKYRNVIYLYYYEEYSAVEIAKILGKKENTIYTWLSRAKEILRDKLGGEWA